MKVVEVVRGERTRREAIDRLLGIIRKSDHRPIVCGDTPGFVVNHAGRGLSTEGLRIVQEGVATFADVDRVTREYVGLPMGPFELFDLTGLDVSSRVLQEIYDGFFQDPRYRPSPFVYRRVQGRLLGRKVGEGFYRYADGKKIEPAEDETSRPSGGLLYVDGPRFVKDLFSKGGAKLVGRALDADAIITCPIGDDATTSALATAYDAKKVVALDAALFPDRLGKGGRATLMSTPITEKRVMNVVHAALLSSGLHVTRIAGFSGLHCTEGGGQYCEHGLRDRTATHCRSRRHRGGREARSRISPRPVCNWR